MARVKLMARVTETQPLVVVTPQAPSGTLSGRVIAKALRDNALLAFPPEAFEEDVVYRRFFGRQQIILNKPGKRAVVQEALRLYPPAFTLVRQARHADKANGTPVPAGGIVFISPWVLHRHRRLWSQPEVFDPTRFLPGAPLPDRFAYLPFGIGPRVCIGAQFALTEATLVLAAMIKAFRIERADDEPVMPVGIVTTQPGHSPLFRLRPRR